MGRKAQKFEVEYALVGSSEVAAEAVEAHDEACALGLVLDELDDDDAGNSPALAYVTIRRLLPLDAVAVVQRAYEEGLRT